MKFMTANYKCDICGNSGVRLWRPSFASCPLICKICLKKRPPREKAPDPKRIPENIILANLSRDYQLIQFVHGTTVMFPAYPSGDGKIWNNFCEPDEVREWWNKLPTK